MDLGSEGFVLLVGLDAGVVNAGHLLEELLLGLSVAVGNDSLLVGVQGKELALFLGGETLVGLGAGLDFGSEDGEERVVLVGHSAGSDTLEGGLEGSFLDLSAGSGIGDGLLNLGESLLSNRVNNISEVALLVALDRLEHVSGSVVHVVFEVDAGVDEEVDEGSLLDELVLLVDTDVLHLLLGVHEVSVLLLLNNVSPLLAKLLGLVARVHIVEDSELGSHHEGEVTDFHVRHKVGNQELVGEDHSSDPLVVRPATEAGNGAEGANVSKHEDNTSAGSSEGLVVGRDLLGSNSLEQMLHVAQMRVHEGVGSSVVGVLVALVELVELVSVVSLAVLLLVLDLRTKVQTIPNMLAAIIIFQKMGDVTQMEKSKHSLHSFEFGFLQVEFACVCSRVTITTYIFLPCLAMEAVRSA